MADNFNDGYSGDHDKWFAEMGEASVKRHLAAGDFSTKDRPFVEDWLDQRERFRERKSRKIATTPNIIAATAIIVAIVDIVLSNFPAIVRLLH